MAGLRCAALLAGAIWPAIMLGLGISRAEALNAVRSGAQFQMRGPQMEGLRQVIVVVAPPLF